MAAKRTSELIPLCHPLPLSVVEVSLDVVADGVEITARVLARPVHDAVGDGEHGRLHCSTFVFSTSATSPTTISLSIAFAMS